MTDRKFTALVVSKDNNGQCHREITERSIDDLPDGDLLVRVMYSSLNYKDALSASGNRGVTRRYPHTPGIDAAGIVEESRDPAFAPGDEVIVSCYDLGMNTPGGFGGYIRVPAGWALPRPANLSLRESMIYGTAGFTAAQSVFQLEQHGLNPEAGKILVTGATGGVGSISVAILAGRGYHVVAASGKPELEPFLLRLGAREILPRQRAVDASDRMLLKGKWAGVVDTVGGEILATAIKSTRYGGVVTCCGNVASPELRVNVYPFILRAVTLVGIDSAECPMATRAEIWNRLAGEWKLDCLEELTTEISPAELDANIELILAGKQTGRVLLRLDG